MFEPHVAMTAKKSAPKQMVPLSLLFIAVTSSWRQALAYNSTCILPAPALGEPRRPVVADQFSVHVEATLLDKNRTVEVIEYFDYRNNRGRLREIEDGIVRDYYYDYSTNELFVVAPDSFTCQVQRLNTSNDVYLLGDNNGHIFSPAAALRFAAQAGSSEVYTGRSQVRGINVHQWRSCQDWPQASTFMDLTWSFMDDMNWVASAAASSVPVECHVTGKAYSSDGSYRSFEHLYEFVHYNDGPFPPHVFEVPRGVVCPGRKNSRPLPYIPASMQFTGETIVEERKAFTYTQEKYDAQALIVIFHYLGYSPFTAKFGTDTLTVVNDFNTGTEYVLDVKRGNCTVSPLTSDPDLARIADPVTLRLRSASGMLGLSGVYTYQGQRTIRGVPCDIWIAQKSDHDLLGLSVNSTYEWAFSEAGWRNLNDPGGVGTIPMQLVQTLQDFGSRQQTVTNVYDYVGSVADILEGINLDSCFIGLPTNRIVFSISNTFWKLLQNFQPEFRRAVRRSVAQIVQVSPLRVANVQCRLQQFTVDVWLDLLSVPPVRSHVSDPAKERPLDEATQDLVAAVRGNRLVIVLFEDDPRPTYITADPNSLRINRYNQVVHVPPGELPAPPAQTKTSPAAAAAAAAAADPTAKEVPAPRVLAKASDAAAHHTAGSASPQHSPCQTYVSSDDQYSAGVMAGTAVAMGAVGGALGLLTHRFLLRPASGGVAPMIPQQGRRP